MHLLFEFLPLDVIGWVDDDYRLVGFADGQPKLSSLHFVHVIPFKVVVEVEPPGVVMVKDFKFRVAYLYFVVLAERGRQVKRVAVLLPSVKKVEHKKPFDDFFQRFSRCLVVLF